jgi:hypothetical protein
MDFAVKRAELLALWERMFRICEQMVSRAERGEVDLKASMVKELNQFLKLSAEILDKAEREAQEARMRAIMYMDNDPRPEDASEGPDGCPSQADNLLPFPLAADLS